MIANLINDRLNILTEFSQEDLVLFYRSKLAAALNRLLSLEVRDFS